MQRVIMLSVGMLSVVILSAVELSIITLKCWNAMSLGSVLLC